MPRCKMMCERRFPPKDSETSFNIQENILVIDGNPGHIYSSYVEALRLAHIRFIEYIHAGKNTLVHTTTSTYIMFTYHM